MNDALTRNQRANAVKNSRDAEHAIYRVMTHLEDLGLDHVAQPLVAALDTLRKTTRVLVSLPVHDVHVEGKPNED